MKTLIKRSILVALALLSTPAFGGDINWAPERPGNSADDPIERPKDLSGRSIKCPRVRAVHSTNVNDSGATEYLFKTDPWLGYQRGRELFVREFSKSDGVFGEPGQMAGRVLEDQVSKIMTRDHVASCALCHNVPFRDGGAGATMFKNSGQGRNTPHVFGGGILEMIGWQTRLKLMEKADVNRNGYIDIGEADTIRAVVTNLPTGEEGSTAIDLGSFGDADKDGKPDLNSVCFVWYVDANGKRIPWARSLKDEGVKGYNLEVQVFGWGHGRAGLAGRIPITSTLRAFTGQAFDNHQGLQACDPTLNEEPDSNGFALVSQLGAQQFYNGRTRDRGQTKDARGVSMDDPDRDGVAEELSEGDMDLIEFYQLNHPTPAIASNTPMKQKGQALFKALNCAHCHVQDWKIEAYNSGDADYTKRYPGDRRFFDVSVAHNPATDRLEGRLQQLTKDGSPARNAFTARNVYSDFIHHDLGPEFYQMQFDGTLIKSWRTAPLWGVGSTAPYGHDGASLSLDEVIRRHGGEAEAESKAYKQLPETDRVALLEFLRGLVLYSTDDLPCDVDGDGKIAEHFIVAGKDTGIERLNPEWLFRVPGQIEGEVTNPHGVKVQSNALTNVSDAYGCKLKYLKDDDRDGFPDALSVPTKPVAQTVLKPATSKKKVGAHPASRS